MYCEKCGYQQLADAKFCDHCGHQLSVADEVAPVVVQPRQPAAGSDKKGRRKIMIGVVAGVLVLFISTGAFLLVTNLMPRSSGTVSPEKPVITLNGVTVDFGGGINLAGESTATVKTQPEEKEEGGGSRQAYDISLEGQSEFTVPLKITLPYDAATETAGVCPQYYNPENGEWETILVSWTDSEAGTISFYTDHLSTYSVYQYANLHTPQAEISHIASGAFDDTTAITVLEEYVNNQDPGILAASNYTLAMEQFLYEGTLHESVPGREWVAGTYLSSMIINNAGEYALSLSADLDKLNNWCGLSMAAFRMIAAKSAGDDVKGARIGYEFLFTNWYNWIGEWGFGIGTTAVLPLKYALQSVEEEAVKANLRGTQKAYTAFYQGSDGQWLRSDEEWLRLFMDCHRRLSEEENPDTGKFALAMDQIIDDYCDEFWQADDITKQIEGKLRGNDTWIQPQLVPVEDKAALRRVFRQQLVNRLNEDVFPIFERYLDEKAIEALEKPLLDYMRVMNKPITVTLDEKIPTTSMTEPKYHGYFVRFEHEAGRDPGFITYQLPDSGSTYELPWFTFLGYSQFGMPSLLSFYKTEADLKAGKPEETMKFALDAQHPVVSLKGEEGIPGIYRFDCSASAGTWNFSSQVMVEVQGNMMKISAMDGRALHLEGSFDEASGQFVGKDYSVDDRGLGASVTPFMFNETTLIFNTDGEPYTATGSVYQSEPLIWDYTATLTINMTKLSDP